ncbi:MAG: precorrin-6y C5,15-methyltransferase (decarboxylating) subunit CbiE [Firmicutes bacterium]|nr:precorrin-6y C5,15-methyltransferase (decarboxylating) subunit CbiE [Bacillota bacterium]
MRKIAVIGMGPGDPDYVLPAAVKTAGRCRVLVGSSRLLRLMAELDPATEHISIEITSDLKRIIERIERDYPDQMVGFLVSGDPGVYSLLNMLKRRYREQEIEVVPGISSVQYLYARIGRPWSGCRILSLHGREDQDLVKEVAKGGAVAILTDPKNDPAKIAGRLSGEGIRGKRVFVGSDLGGPYESVVSGSLTEISGMRFEHMNVMVIEDEE